MEPSDDTVMSIKYGFAQAMAEHGLSPSEVEEMLQKEAKASLGTVLGTINPAKEIMTTAMAGGVIGGSLLGIGTAALRSKVERMAEGAEDNEMREKRIRIDLYKKMINDLKMDQLAGVS